MSRTEVGRTLRDEDIRPHRVRYWLHSQDTDFSEKTNRICDLYRRPPKDATVLCIDEKTSMQALGRPRTMTTPSSLKDRRFEYEYRRNGTLNLFGAFEPATGKVFGECRARRTADDMLAFMEKVAERYPGRVIVIWDNLNTHKGDRWQEFNRKHGGRFEFVYTPFHASWLNQIEIWFGILHRRILRYGIFNSTEELADRVLGFVSHWNEVDAHPFALVLPSSA